MLLQLFGCFYSSCHFTCCSKLSMKREHRIFQIFLLICISMLLSNNGDINFHALHITRYHSCKSKHQTQLFMRTAERRPQVTSLVNQQINIFINTWSIFVYFFWSEKHSMRGGIAVWCTQCTFVWVCACRNQPMGAYFRKSGNTPANERHNLAYFLWTRCVLYTLGVMASFVTVLVLHNV